MYRLEVGGGGVGQRIFVATTEHLRDLTCSRIVSAWNNLPKDVVNAGSQTLFRNR